MKTTVHDVYIDGGSRGNPGPAGSGVYFPGVVRVAEYLGTQTNNFAEYTALVTALRFAAAMRCDAVKVFSDSELVVKQVRKEYKVKNANILPLYEAALRWIGVIPRFSIEHVRREFNKDADALANDAMDARANRVTWEQDDA
jgi:ribonuclease HI